MLEQDTEALTILARQSARESRARTYSRHLPIVLTQGRGVYVTTVDGSTYIDCLAGAGSLALGHNHPVVRHAIEAVLSSGLPLQCLDLATHVRDDFVTVLSESFPAEFGTGARILICGPTGADSVEAALKLVKTATGRETLLSFHGGYHGATAGALSVSSGVKVKRPVSDLPGGVHFLPYPSDYQCPFGVGGARGAELGLRYIESLLDDVNSGITAPAGMILEVVQGEGGVIPAPDTWLREIRRITLEHDIPMIVDEIQTGLGRTGRLYAFQHADIVPDIVVLSKALGGGLPLSVMVCRKDLDVWEPGAHIGTFRGNQLAMAAGTATLRFIIENDLSAHVEEMGVRLINGLRDVQSRTMLLREIRGRGLMVGAEVEAGDSLAEGIESTEAHTTARRIQAACLDRGLIIELGGRKDRVARFLPPLIVTAEEVDTIVDRFGDAVEAVERNRPIGDSLRCQE